MCHVVSNQNKVKGVTATKISKLLEASQCSHVISKIFSKFIPDKHECLKIIFFNNSFNPVNQAINIKRKCFELALLGNLHNLTHEFLYTLSSITIKFSNNSIHIISRENTSILCCN
ncbi:hypothetical protein SDC9_56691 [bioreactor metagenome]|uniref:Uncharacterized protein n=1 Tax=bioreactor metagenome TaxID=1076179 RepID=A0A644X2I9_9ZZZZ